MSATAFAEPDAPPRKEASRRSQTSVNAQWNRVTPRNIAPPWLVPTLQALARLRDLLNDWDGYGSPPIQSAALQSAQRLVAALESLALDLPMPSVSPVTGGGIGFTWQHETRELEIEVLPDGSTQYLAVVTDPATGQEATDERPLPLDQPEYGQALAKWLLDG